MLERQDGLTALIVLFLTVGMLTSFSVGVGAAEPTTDDLDDAIDDVGSYEYETETNSTSVIVQNGETQETSSEAVGNGVVDITDEKMKQITSTKTTGESALEGDRIETQVYLVDGTYYTATTVPGEDTEWIQMDVPENAGVAGGPLAEYTSLLNASDVETVDREDLNGTETYVLELDVDMDAYLEEMTSELNTTNNSMDANDTAMNSATSGSLDGLTQEMTMTLWINTETDLPIKSELVTETSMDGLGASDANNTSEAAGEIESIDTTTTQTTHYEAYNEPVDIDLPEEAENAQNLDEQLAELETGLAENNSSNIDEGDVNDSDAEELSEEATENDC
ncbi:hypothetical protein [Halalkalicoccus jeotgali]|uniref:Uncharacterized protein n=1 Tax=Halalkalicoccus jeotgali (strain DSM 18796 / CECT 7217 / JCM 14584 / KCTC 4019 / B3) TaxID=795797 RepID=D8JC32_HALJB|nr:hypothetical protein [Halalkalicoccus jeotgali]ADJ16939.1 hypothetical protein HacjB3_17983 [Halalkalicoccus jeotgali B3]ELY38624.1 hypothetical protein C497_06779 [Halalkalicoccus jeotgali B3]